MSQETESESSYVLCLYTDAEKQGENMGEVEVLNADLKPDRTEIQETQQGNHHKKEIKTKVEAVWALGRIVYWREQIR